VFKQGLEGKILFVFSDPGGAKPCLALSDKLNKSNLVVLSDREYSFYNDFETDVIRIQELEELEEYIESFKPDLIFTGTSYTSSLEKTAIKSAKKKNIKVFSFVDHWTAISERFTGEQENFELPDQIWVIDEKAMNIAISEGISAELIVISGNPYHAWLKNWKPKNIRSVFLNAYNIPLNKQIILFAPDPLSNVNGVEAYGYDEYSVSQKMIELVEQCSNSEKEKYHFLVKAHPNQNYTKLCKLFINQTYFTVLPQSVDTNESIYHADVVMGFFSSILIEAEIMGKVVIRFLVKDSKKDPFFNLNLGTIVNEDNLMKTILKLR
jgi:hypothetical protein